MNASWVCQKVMVLGIVRHSWKTKRNRLNFLQLQKTKNIALFSFVFPLCFPFCFLHVCTKLGTSCGPLKHWILLSVCRRGQILDSDSKLERQVLFSISIRPSVSVLLLKHGVSWNQFTFTFNVPVSVSDICIATARHCASNEAVTKLFRPYSFLKCLSAAVHGWASARAPILFQTRPPESTKKKVLSYLSVAWNGLEISERA